MRPLAFRWDEAGEERFVDVVNLGEFAKRNLAAGMADTIIVTNLLERLGKDWYLHTPLTRISGLTEYGFRPPQAAGVHPVR
jgi:hypothetical protein